MMSQNLRAAAHALARILPKPLAAPSAVPGVTFYRREAANAEGTYITRPMASFLLQGEKLTVAGGITRLYREGEFLVCCGTFPGHCTVTTPSSDHPLAGIHQFYRGGSFVQLSDPWTERMDQGCQRRNGQQLLLNFFLCPAWGTMSEMARAAALKALVFPGVLPGWLKKRSLRALLSNPYALSVLHTCFGSHDRRD